MDDKDRTVKEPETPPSPPEAGEPFIARTPGGLLPVDALLLSYAAAVIGLIVARLPAVPRPGLQIGLHAFAGLAVLALARWTRRRSPAGSVAARAVFVCIAVPSLFLALGGLVPYVNPFRAESVLKAIDDLLFLGRNPNVLVSRLATPALTEYLQIVYASYYFLPLVLLAGLLVSRRFGAIDRALTAVIFCLFVSYLGYFAVPAIGPIEVGRTLGYPWPPYAEELRAGTSSLPGLAFADRIREALYRADIHYDCFPSGHAAMSLVVLLLARRFHRPVFWVLLVPVLSLVFSTIYLRYHYAVDVIAGIGVTALTLWATPRLHAAFRRRLAG